MHGKELYIEVLHLFEASASLTAHIIAKRPQTLANCRASSGFSPAVVTGSK